ncbi:MAG: hypothetical protein AAFS10_02925 [Myxococcota bacterium]
MKIVECRGSEPECEGACVMARHGAVVETLGVAWSDRAQSCDAQGRLDLSCSAPWIAARRIFNDANQAERFVRALELASVQVEERTDLTGQQMSQRTGECLSAQTAAGPLYRIARWVESRVALEHHQWLADQPRTRVRIGGQPTWWQPRPNPLDPRGHEHPMVCMAQFSGELDTALPGDERTRFFVFGASNFDGDDGRYAILWQNAVQPSEHYALLVRDDPMGFAVVSVDFVQASPDPIRGPIPDDGFHKSVLIWRSTPGAAGHWDSRPFQGGIQEAAIEMVTSVSGLEDEGYRVAGGDLFQQAWLGESLRRLTLMSGRPESVETRLFFYGVEYEYVHLHGGYTLWTNATLNTVEDDFMARAWPGIGGEPEAVTGLVQPSGHFGEGPLIPVMTFAPGETMDHPHVEYGDQGLVYVAVPREVCGARVGWALMQTF